MIPEGLPTMEVLVQHKMEAICLKPGRFQPNPWLGRGVWCAAFFCSGRGAILLPTLSRSFTATTGSTTSTACYRRKPWESGWLKTGFETEKRTLRSNPRNPLSIGWGPLCQENMQIHQKRIQPGIQVQFKGPEGPFTQVHLQLLFKNTYMDLKDPSSNLSTPHFFPSLSVPIPSQWKSHCTPISLTSSDEGFPLRL